MFVLALDEMLRAATGDRAGRTTQRQGARRAACGVGGAVGPPTPGRVPPSTPRRSPDRRLPARTRCPGARGGATARRPTWAVSPGQGCTHLMGRNSPDTRGGRGTGLRPRAVDGCGSPTRPARVGQTYAAKKGVWSQRIALRRC